MTLRLLVVSLALLSGCAPGGAAPSPVEGGAVPPPAPRAPAPPPLPASPLPPSPGPTPAPAPAGAGPCGLSPSDWCPSPPGDPCGAHKDAASCKADARCNGMRYRGESVVACQYDARGFATNCPTVGCISR